MRRCSNLCGLGAFFVLCGCSGDSFTSATGAKPDSGNPASGGNQASAGGRATGGGAATGGSTGSGAAQATGGGGGGAAGSASGGTVGAGGGTAVEAGTVEASSPATWCTGQQALFCEDFDRYTDIDRFLNSPAWSTYSAIGGQFAFATDGSVPSPPNALRVTTTATTGVKTLLAKTLPPFSSPPNGLRMEFTLRINKAVNIGYLTGAAFAAILNGPEVTDGAVAIAIATPLVGGGDVLEVGYLEPNRDGGPGFSSKTAQGTFPQLNHWLGRWALDIQYSASSAGRAGCARLMAANIDQLQSCLPLPATLSNPRQITVVLGLYSIGLTNNSGDVEVEFDNLVVTAR